MKAMKKLMEALNVRLQNKGRKKEFKDKVGAEVLLDTSVFSDEVMKTALETSISMLNQFEVCSPIDEYQGALLNKYQDLLVQGAAIQLLAGQALLERGREFTITDSGVNFTPPPVSEILTTQWCFEYQMYMDKIRLLKQT